MLKRLVDEGLVSRDEHKLIHFSDRGHEVAERIVARHRTVEAYLVKVMGIPWDDVHEEAARHGALHLARGSRPRCSR